MKTIELKDVFGDAITLQQKGKETDKEFKEIIDKIDSKEYTVLISLLSMLDDKAYRMYLKHKTKMISLLFKPSDTIILGSPEQHFAVVYPNKLTDKQIDILTTKIIIH